MKYYKKELWQLMHSSDEKQREEARMQFRESAKEYGPYFEKVKSKLPTEFLVTFNENKWFHDFIISDISINNNESSTTVNVAILSDDVRFILTLKDVTKISVDIPSKDFWMPSGMKWGYTEFELLDNQWNINILCDINCELKFGFKTISLNEISSK